MKKWSQKEVEKLDSKGFPLYQSGKYSVREIAEKVHSKYFRTRSVESVRHKIRQLVNA